METPEYDHIHEITRGAPVDPERYDEIDRRNRSSFYLIEPQQVRVITSVSGQETRLHPSDAYAGNMSEVWGRKYLPDAERVNQARQNVDAFIRSLEIEPSNVWILKPQRDYSIPLQLVDVDRFEHTQPVAQQLPQSGDMLVTKNPNTVLAVRPADCPVIIGYGFNQNNERMITMTHIAHGGAAAGFVEQSLRQSHRLGIDPNSLRLYISGGAHAEHFPFRARVNPTEGKKHLEHLFVNLRVTHDEQGAVYYYAIDTPHFVYAELLRLGIHPYQIFMDTSDTADPRSQYSSHGRAARSLQAWEREGSLPDGDYEIGQRDIVLALQNHR